MSSFSNTNNNNNNNNSTVYRSKLFRAAAEKQTSAKPVYKALCKVCQDAGKTEQEYTNHSVRDKSGKTVCPTLLSQECRNCYKRGHTTKYCTLLKEQTAPVKKAYEPVQKKISTPKNVFMVLESDSEEEPEEILQEEPTEFDNIFPMIIAPALPKCLFIAPALPVDQRPVLNYGKIIQKENDPETYAKAKEEEMRKKAEKYAEEREAKRKADMIEWSKTQAKVEADREAREARMCLIKKTTSWFDAESSDEEDEEEHEEVVDNSAW